MVRYDLVVVGGGPAGYPAAIRGVQLGLKVALIEKDKLGGTCVHRGCIPTKAYLESVRVLKKAKRAKDFGIMIDQVDVDFGLVRARKDQVVRRLTEGLEKLVEKKKVLIKRGTARFEDRGTIELKQTGERLFGKNIVIATGSVPKMFPFIEQSLRGQVTSDGILELEAVPKSIGIIGAGYVGLELGQIFHGLGAEVFVLEALSRILANQDKDISRVLCDELLKEGISIETNVVVRDVRKVAKEFEIHYETMDGHRERRTEQVLVAIGRAANTEGLELEKIGVQMEEGCIRVDKRFETNIPGIYAAGDVTGGVMLAHAAMAEGECAAENAAGGNRIMDDVVIPRCVYTSPEIAAVGLSEEDASRDFDIVVGKFPIFYNSMAGIIGEEAGLVKVISEKKTGQIVGCHIIGPHAVDLINEVTSVMNLEGTYKDLAHSIHPHPSVSEIIKEAALNTEGIAIHI